jgi:hypothetical protein
MRDVEEILARLVELERRVNKTMIRPGVVKKDDKGDLRIAAGKTNDGQDFLLPKLMKSQHHGFLNENVPFEEGQSVMILSADGDFRNAITLPYSYSDSDPLPDDAAKKKMTGRIRKPREEGQDKDELPDAVKEEVNKAPEKAKDREKQKDDPESDHYWRTDFEGHYRRKGKLQTLVGKPDPEDSQNQNPQSGNASSGQQSQAQKGSGETGEQVWHKIGSAEMLIVDGKIRFKIGEKAWTFTDQGIEQKIGDQTWTWKDGSTEIAKGKITHDKRKIDKDHVHTKVQPGGGKTGETDE